MTLSKFAPLVTTKWLREQIMNSLRTTNKLSDSHRVLDTSWMPEPEVDGYKQFYLQAHIPTALYFDLKEVSPPSDRSTATFSIPDPNVFQDYVEHLAISNNTHVIAYDRFNSRSSLRTWFLFRLFGHDKVSVLDGGLKQWVTDGFQVTTEEPVVEKQNFSVNFRKDLLRDFPSVLANIDTKAEQLMDARTSESFYVSNKDSPGGHIPGAHNIPYASLFNEDGTFKSQKDLKELFANAGVDLTKPVVSSCQTGMTACGLIAAAYILGREDVPLYNGSFSEWRKLAKPDKIVREKGK
jgi:thiosulfate/3-mercaptopyruvate sulfurtransferase